MIRPTMIKSPQPLSNTVKSSTQVEIEVENLIKEANFLEEVIRSLELKLDKVLTIKPEESISAKPESNVVVQLASELGSIRARISHSVDSLNDIIDRCQL